MRITSPVGWVALLALGVLLACGVLWGIWGSIPTKVEGSGILMSRGGVFAVSARASGSVKFVRFNEGDVVLAGQVVATIGQPGIRDKILSAEDKISQLKAQYDQQRDFGARDMALEEQSIAEQRANLLQTNEGLSAQLKSLKKRLKDQERLVKLGLITRMKALNTQIEIDDRTEKIRQNKNKIKQLSIQKLQTRNRIEENLLNLENQIESARDQLYSLQNTLREDALPISMYTGKIVSVRVEVGDVVQTGSQLMTVEMMGGHSRFLEAVLFFPAAQGKRIHRGMKAHVSASTLKKEQYGSIIGLVTFVSAFPTSPQVMERVLQNKKMVEDLSKDGAPIEVRVALVPDVRTFSRYKWTSSNGPPVSIETGTVCSGSAIVKRQPPIQLIIPLMKKYVLGIGQDQTPGKS
jgi:HlyD family secretion protein